MAKITNSFSTDEKRLSIDEKFLRFTPNDKNGVVLIPLKNIVHIGDKGDKTSFEYFLVKSDLPLGPATGALSVQGQVAAWLITSSAANDAAKVKANSQHFVSHWEKALESNMRHYHIDGNDFPYPLDGACVSTVMASWLIEA